MLKEKQTYFRQYSNFSKAEQDSINDICSYFNSLKINDKDNYSYNSYVSDFLGKSYKVESLIDHTRKNTRTSTRANTDDISKIILCNKNQNKGKPKKKIYFSSKNTFDMTINNYHFQFPKFNTSLLTIDNLPIASGGFGNIYKGKFLSNYIAKKYIVNYKEKDFFKEIYATYVYRNTNTPTVYGILEEKGQSFGVDNRVNNTTSSLILEYINGGTLREKMKKLKITKDKDELLYIMYIIELAKAIEFIHSKGLIHRDIKPENIIISNNNEVKLIDFGISKECEKTSEYTTSEKGSIFYEPPENTVEDIYKEETDDDTNEENTNFNDIGKTSFGCGRKISKAYDIWALGVIISEIYSGEHPWGEELRKKPNKILLNLMNKVPFPIPNSIKDKQIVQLIKHCTEILPKNRIEIKEILSIMNKIFNKKITKISNTCDITKLYPTKESKQT